MRANSLLSLPPPPYFSPLSDFPPHSTFPTSEAGYKLIKTGNEEAQYRTSTGFFLNLTTACYIIYVNCYK